MPDFECDARAQRRLLENQREKAAGQRGAITVGARLHVRSQLEEDRALARDSIPCR